VTGGKPNEDNPKDKYNSVYIGDEETQNQEENDRLKKEIEKERKLAFNACSILKIEEEYIGNFFFGKKVRKEEKKKRKTFSEEEDNEEADDEEEDIEEDYTLSKFYQSNTREELQNQLKDLNFEDEEEEVGEEETNRKESDDDGLKGENVEVKEQELLSGSDEENEDEKELNEENQDEKELNEEHQDEKEFLVESGGRGDFKTNTYDGKHLYLGFNNQMRRLIKGWMPCFLVRGTPRTLISII